MSKAQSRAAAPHAKAKQSGTKLAAYREKISASATASVLAQFQQTHEGSAAISDVLSKLEYALIDTKGVAEVLLELGTPSGHVGEICSYLGHNLHEHNEKARVAFDRLHTLLTKRREG
jgi:hypothetical protein